MYAMELNVPVGELPALFRAAVAAVDRATLIEIGEDGALLGRRTTFATGFQATRLSFHDLGDGRSAIRVESTNAGSIGFVPFSGDLLETGRAVLDEVRRLAGTA